MNSAVLISGGVDSSVALRLLQEQGHSLTAFYLKIWLEDELSFLGMCPWQEDLSFVEAVCKQAAIQLEIISLQKEYWERVVAHTIAEIKAGRTPNPDILCNQRVKFGAFYDKIDASFDFVATGHYARVEPFNDVLNFHEMTLTTAENRHEQNRMPITNGNNHVSSLVTLHTTPDPIKDQTYFLSHLSQAQLARAAFPLGNLTKAQVREHAQRFDLPNKDRKDSQGICFLGKLKFNEFIKYHLGEQPGHLIEYETGKKLGMHRGFWYHTIGQRQGSGLSGGPWYVVSKKPEENLVFVSRNYYTPEKMRDTFVVSECNWILGEPTKQSLKVKLRHGPAFNEATLESLHNGSFKVKLAQRDQGIAQGQYAVFYDGTHCLGGGVISYDTN